jgi:hypothetical protein
VEIPLSGRSGVLAGYCLIRSLRVSSAELGKRQEMFDTMLWGNGNVLLNLRRCYAAGRLMLRLKHASAGSPGRSVRYEFNSGHTGGGLKKFLNFLALHFCFIPPTITHTQSFVLLDEG